MNVVKMETIPTQVCRICLQQSEEESMASIFDRDSAETSICIYEKIEKCAAIKMLTDPELPSHICRKCNAFLNIAYKFRGICRNADNYLRQFVCKATRICTGNEEEDMAEYLLDYPLHNNSELVEVANVVQELPPKNDEDSEFVYEAVDEYTDMWMNPDFDVVIEEEEQEEMEMLEDSCSQDSQGSQVGVEASRRPLTRRPVKTLGITSDGAAVIRVKSQQQQHNHNQQQQELELHQELNQKQKAVHICDICGNAYPRKYSLEAHMRRHRDERPFECEICHQAFHLNFQLTRHIRKHTGVRPFKCDYCERAFADRSTLVKHERIHRNERPYKCDTCQKTFTYSSVLKVHQLTHTGEKPFNCGICGKRFARGHHLRAHLETLMHQNDPRTKVLLKQIKREEDLVYDTEDC